MRSLLIASVIVCVALMAGVAVAATPGQISDGTLAQMGLSNMQPISDAQGAEVRGMGFAWVGGTSIARMYGSVSANSYGAASAQPGALAAGASASIVASGWGVFPPVGNSFGAVNGVIAVGGAVSYAR